MTAATHLTQQTNGLSLAISENYFSLKANILRKEKANPTAKYIFYLSGNLAKIEENYNLDFNESNENVSNMPIF